MAWNNKNILQEREEQGIKQNQKLEISCLITNKKTNINRRWPGLNLLPYHDLNKLDYNRLILVNITFNAKTGNPNSVLYYKHLTAYSLLLNFYSLIHKIFDVAQEPNNYKQP